MKGFLAVARREIEEKRFVFPAALVASLVPFAVPLVRGMHGAAAVEIREWTAIGLALTFAAGLAVALGATTVAGELASRRLGFYFSRPISGIALWAAKLGAACFMALGVAALVYAPTLAAARDRAVLPEALLFSALGVIGTVLISHVAVLALRPRTPLLALDVAALLLLSLCVVFLIQRFVMALANDALGQAEAMLVAATSVALTAAGLVAVTRGRSDSRAAHRALSATLWSLLAAGVAATAGYALWVFSVAPKDASQIDWVTTAGKGSWIVLETTSRGWEPNFLYDTATGRYHRTGASWRTPVLSHDGARAVWFEPTAQGGPYDVVTWKLDDPAAKPVQTFSLPAAPYAAFLSDDGARLATIAGGVLSVWDPAARSSLGSVRVADERDRLYGFFADSKRIRVLRFQRRLEGVDEDRLDILEFDASKKTLVTIVAVEDASSCISDETGARLLVLGKTSLTLRDGHTGALLAPLSERSQKRRVGGRFTSDGRIVVAVVEGSDASSVQARTQTVHVDVFTRDGRLERTLDIPGRQRISLGGEVAPGQLVLGAGSDLVSEQNRAIYLANLSTGELKQVAEGLSPVRTLSDTGSEATKLFFGPGRSLVHFDALTGERRVLLGKGAR